MGYPIDIPKIAFSKKRQLLPYQSCTVFDNGQAEGIEGHSSSNTGVSVEERHFWNHPSEIQITRLGDNLVAVEDWRTRGQKKRLGWKCVNGVLRITFIISMSLFRPPGHRRDDHRHAVSERGLQGDDIHAIQRGVQRL